MKKIALIICFIFFAGDMFSQIEEIRNKSLVITNPSIFPYGVNINMELPVTTRWAREFNFSANGKGDIFSFGVVANGAKLEYGYIGGDRMDNSNINYANPWMVFLPAGKIGIGTLTPHYLLYNIIEK
ncbi:hypothetical protein [Dysgonomonas sp. ZJ279]|uniref:hypothetical protein n=1 Tax=Dysgonomonas sp. ZJ279 TaxID=2709796 RepID=UPI0013EB6B8F|nr:hypothetical protein [Dysgonomonas sp. ZJ279]